MTHEQIQEMLGAFVLNAVDPIEYKRIAKHVADCADCAREVSLLSAPAAELAWLPAPEEAGELVERITTSLPWRPRKILVRLTMGAAAVAVVAATFFGVSLRASNVRQDEITSVIAAAQRTVTLDPQHGFGGKARLYLAQGRAVLAFDDLPAAGRDRAYQLWALRDGTPTSMSVIDASGRAVRLFDWTGTADTFAVTIEPSDGSPVPTSDPVLVSAAT